MAVRKFSIITETDALSIERGSTVELEKGGHVTPLAQDTLRLDLAEVRRRNLVPAEKMPYRTGLTARSGAAIVYDSGDFPKMMETVLGAIDHAGFAARQKKARQQGRFLGLGMAMGIKGTGRGPFESARVVPLASIRAASTSCTIGRVRALARTAADRRRRITGACSVRTATSAAASATANRGSTATP